MSEEPIPKGMESLGTQPFHRKPVFVWLLVIIFHFAVSYLAVLIGRPSMNISSQGADPLLYSWIFGWDWHIVTTHPLSLFNANIFYPAANSLASSDHRLGLLPLWAITWILTKKQFFSDEIVLYLAYALTGVTLHVWVRNWTNDHISAGLAAAWINLNPYRIYDTGAVHILSIMWLPLALLGMDRFLTKGGFRWWLLMVTMFWMQFQVSFYHAYGILLLMAAYFILAQFLRPIRNRKRAWIGVLLGCVVLFITLLPFVVPYVSQTAGAYTSVGAFVDNSPSFPNNFLISSQYNLFWGRLLGMTKDLNLVKLPQPMWMGIGIPLLGIFGFMMGRKKSQNLETRRLALLFLLSSLFIFIIILGPYLKLGSHIVPIPLPFLWLMKIAPGFDKMHATYRFLNTFLTIWAPLVGLGISVILRQGRGALLERGKVSRSLACLIFVLMIVDIWCFPESESEIRVKEEARPLSIWLAQTNIDGGIIELPFPEKQDFAHSLYMMQSLHHFKPMVNGYGSFYPPSHNAIKKEILPSLPDEAALRKMATIGVRTYILHLDLADFYCHQNGTTLTSDEFLAIHPDAKNELTLSESLLRAFSENPNLVEIARFPKDIVYQYQKPIEITTRLEGAIINMVKSGPADMIMDIHFRGEGGAAWRGLFPTRPLKVKYILTPINGGPPILAPTAQYAYIPYVILPEDQEIYSFTVEIPKGFGVYRIQATTDQKGVTIIPTVISFEQPVQ